MNPTRPIETGDFVEVVLPCACGDRGDIGRHFVVRKVLIPSGQVSSCGDCGTIAICARLVVEGEDGGGFSVNRLRRIEPPQNIAETVTVEKGKA